MSHKTVNMTLLVDCRWEQHSYPPASKLKGHVRAYTNDLKPHCCLEGPRDPLGGGPLLPSPSGQLDCSTMLQPVKKQGHHSA